MFVSSRALLMARRGCHVSHSRGIGVSDPSSVPPSSSPLLPPPEKLLTLDWQHQTIARLRNSQIPQRPLSRDNSKRAAVLIPLCFVNERLSLLYTLRTVELKRHRGQVSFPGGMEDSGDETLQDTALREAEEEIGVPRQSVQVWGQGNIFIGKDFSVLPVVGFLGRIDPATLPINPDEVEAVFAVSLDRLVALEYRRSTQFRYKGQRRLGYSIPVYLGREHRVWGLTAIITHMFLTALLPDNYDPRIPYVRPVN